MAGGSRWQIKRCGDKAKDSRFDGLGGLGRQGNEEDREGFVREVQRANLRKGETGSQ